LSYLANTQTDRQTDKQTKSGKNITSLAEVIIHWFWSKADSGDCQENFFV